jgi:hypothetical protein
MGNEGNRENADKIILAGVKQHSQYLLMQIKVNLPSEKTGVLSGKLNNYPFIKVAINSFYSCQTLVAIGQIGVALWSLATCLR